MERYTPEYRGELFETEWCVIDEYKYLFGYPTHVGMTQSEAEALARKLNKENK